MNELPLRNENILLLGPKFYGYCNYIKQEIVNLGGNVIFNELELWNGGRYSHRGIIRKTYCRLKEPNWEDKTAKRILKSIGENKIDRLIVIAVYSATIELIYELKRRNPSIKTYIYFWDAFSTWNFSYLIEHFDYCYSFDRNDCERYKSLQYLPLFYRKTQLSNNIECKYDITHIGTLGVEYSKRLDICPVIYQNGLKDNQNNFIYLVWKNRIDNSKVSPIKSLIKLLLRDPIYLFSRRVNKCKNSTPIIHESPLPLEIVSKIEKSSRALLDINMNRSGLAMRLIGAIANGKKIITNNKFIVEEDFYSPDNILVLDEKNPIVHKEWLLTPPSKIDISYLRIDNWIKTILKIS